MSRSSWKWLLSRSRRNRNHSKLYSQTSSFKCLRNLARRSKKKRRKRLSLVNQRSCLPLNKNMVQWLVVPIPMQLRNKKRSRSLWCRRSSWKSSKTDSHSVDKKTSGLQFRNKAKLIQQLNLVLTNGAWRKMEGCRSLRMPKMKARLSVTQLKSITQRALIWMSSSTFMIKLSA